MKKTGILILCLLLALLTAVFAGAAAFQSAKEQHGAVVSQTVNRVNLSFENVEQTFSPSDNGEYMAQIAFSAEKTEADFYAVLHNLSCSGMGFDRMEILPAEDDLNNTPFAQAHLRASDGKCITSKWLIRLYFHAQSGTTLTPTLTLDYSSGVNEQTAARRLFEVPLRLVIEDA